MNIINIPRHSTANPNHLPNESKGKTKGKIANCPYCGKSVSYEDDFFYADCDRLGTKYAHVACAKAVQVDRCRTGKASMQIRLFATTSRIPSKEELLKAYCLNSITGNHTRQGNVSLTSDWRMNLNAVNDWLSCFLGLKLHNEILLQAKHTSWNADSIKAIKWLISIVNEGLKAGDCEDVKAVYTNGSYIILSPKVYKAQELGRCYALLKDVVGICEMWLSGEVSEARATKRMEKVVSKHIEKTALYFRAERTKGRM